MNNTSSADQFLIWICKTSGIFFSFLSSPYYLFMFELIPVPLFSPVSLSFSSCLNYNSYRPQVMRGQGHGSNNCMSKLRCLIFSSMVTLSKYFSWEMASSSCCLLPPSLFQSFYAMLDIFKFFFFPPILKKAQWESKLDFCHVSLFQAAYMQYVLRTRGFGNLKNTSPQSVNLFLIIRW